MKIKFMLTLLFLNTSLQANNGGMQVKTFIDTFLINEQAHVTVTAQKDKLSSEIDNHVKAYQELWDIKERINLKCSSGIESLPNYSSVTPNTELGILIKRKCEKHEKLKTALTNLQNNSDVVRNILKKFDISIEKAIDGSDAIVLVKEEKIEVDSIEKRVMKDGEIINGMTESDKEILKSLPKDKEKLEKQIAENADSGCSVYAKVCDHLPKWPDKDTAIGGITCDDLRKSEGATWTSRYDFYCKGGTVYLKSDKYQYIKRMPCQIGGQDIAKNSTKFHQMSLGSYHAYSCVGGMGVNVGKINFMPVKCSEHGKKPGEEWFLPGERKEQKCQGVCYAGKNVTKTRAVEYLWRCDKFGHIVPSLPGGKNTYGQGKVVKIDAQVFRQKTKKGKFIGSSCEKANREIVKEIRCDLSQKEDVSCPRSHSIAMSMEERDMIDDMMFGVPSALCREKTVFKNVNKCGGKGTKYLECSNNCRNKCEADKENELNSSDFKIVNYYPHSQKTK